MTRPVVFLFAMLLAATSLTSAAAPVAAADGTSVSGTLTGSQHWTLAGSPYTFTDNVTVAAGATLTIDPGVTVAGGNYLFNIAGVVTATGTPIDPILLSRVDGPKMYPGSGGSSFAWTEFRGNSYVEPERGPLPALSHVWFNGTTLYMWYQSAGSTIPEPYTFSDARFSAGRGLDGCCNAWAGSRISVESGWGVFDAMTYNLSISITDSNLVAPTSGCSSSLRYMCEFATMSGTHTVTAKNVWWGTTDPAEVNRRILDGNDVPGLPIIDIDPIRTAPLDLLGPTSKITTPSVQANSGTINGTAADYVTGATGVASVGVSLRDTVTGDWWNGTTWATSETFVPATGTETWSFALPALTDGRSYAVRAHATDVAGNDEWGTANATVTADGLAPTGTFYIMSPSDNQFVNASPVGFYMQAGPDVTAYKVSLDGTHWDTRPWNMSNATLDIGDPAIGGNGAEGVYTLRIAWRDAAGNWSPVASNTFVYDSLAPTGTVTINNGAMAAASLVVPIAVNATDAFSAQALLSNDGVTWAPPTQAGAGLTWSLSANGGSTAKGSHTVHWKLADLAGNETSPTATTVMYDSSVPTINSPTVPAILAPQTAGSSSASLRFKWSGTDDSGIARYDVQRSVNGAAYAALAQPTAGSLTTSASYNAWVRYRVRSVDRAGRVSGWAYTTTVKPLLTQQSSSSITYGRTWRRVSSSSYLGGSTRYATSAGAYANYRFTGRSIAWVAAKGPSRGSAKVYIDGSYVKTISLYATSSTARQLLYSKAWSSSGTHTIKIVVVGTSGHPRVDVDGFIRLF